MLWYIFRCECLPVTCKPPPCPVGTLVKVVSPGIGKPGFCCDKHVCEPGKISSAADCNQWSFVTQYHMYSKLMISSHVCVFMKLFYNYK